MPTATITYRYKGYTVTLTIESDDTNVLLAKIPQAIAQIEHDNKRPSVSFLSAWRQAKRRIRDILVSR